MKLIDLFSIPLPGHSNRSPEPPNKFAALAAMENPPISGWARYLYFQPGAKTIRHLITRSSSRSRSPIVLPDSFIAHWNCVLSPLKRLMHARFVWWNATRNETIGQHDRDPWSGWSPGSPVISRLMIKQSQTRLTIADSLWMDERKACSNQISSPVISSFFVPFSKSFLVTFVSLIVTDPMSIMFYSASSLASFD